MARPFALLAVAIAPALSVSAVAAQPGPPAVETFAQALAEDADQYAAQFQVNRDEALRRLSSQQASVATTDAIAREFAGRLAGIAIEHAPEYRIVVLLTGTQPVGDRTAAGIPIVFRTGAKATRTQAIAAMKTHLIDLRSELPGLRGAGYDQRTGEIVLLIRPEDAQRLGIDAIRARAEQVGGVPVRVVVNDLLESNMEIDGGERVDGINGETGRRNICTSGFVVTDGVRGGIATAAHCPDALTYHAPDGSSVPLAFAGQWGLAYQDVQINLSADATEPMFRATGSAGPLRRLATWRNRGSTRAGDFVCHFGESSGYSCAPVELTDYAPPGALCGGPCEPTWVTVRGPGCIAGDSGGPVFSGSVAFGIAKGINRSSSGRCNFYYYMSTDYLPPPWRLLTTGDAISSPRGRP